jgi:YVTN family beta-propeller protein
MKTLLALVLAAGAAFAAEGYHVLNKINIGGTGGWDYVTVDSAAQRLYASHGTSVAVVDLNSGKVVGTIPELRGVHGIAIAAEFGKGFITNGGSNSVTVFDLKTLAKTGEVATGTNPDAACYEPRTKRLFTFNGRSNDATAIDARTNAVAGTFPVGGKPEFCQVDGTGKIYVNIEDTSEVIEIDASKPAVTRRAAVRPCEEPSGLAIDIKASLLFSVCGNKTMAITDYKAMKMIGTTGIGEGTDGAGYDPGTGLAFSANGGDATLSIVKNVAGKWQTVDTVATERGARTLTVDPKTHKVYLLAAEFGPAAEAKGGKKGRPPVLPDTFHVLVVGK